MKTSSHASCRVSGTTAASVSGDSGSERPGKPGPPSGGSHPVGTHACVSDAGRVSEYPDSGVGSGLLDAAEWEAVARALRLSGREFEIVRGVFDCQKETAIADGLGIAPRTVNTHLTAIYGKLGLPSRAAAIRYAIDRGLR